MSLHKLLGLKNSGQILEANEELKALSIDPKTFWFK